MLYLHHLILQMRRMNLGEVKWFLQSYTVRGGLQIHTRAQLLAKALPTGQDS